jgi:uncharacterized repeat protein (TIGR02543 family)
MFLFLNFIIKYFFVNLLKKYNMNKGIVLFLIAVFSLVGCSKSEDEIMITVTFDSNGGNDIASQTFNSGYLVKESTPIDKGFTFVGWYYDEELQLPFKYSNVIRENSTLYAKWAPNVINPVTTSYSSNMNQILSFPHNLAFDESGILFLSTDAGIYKITPSGAISSFVNGNYWGMSFDSKGNLFALKPENTLSNIDKIDASGIATPFLRVDYFASNLFFDKKKEELFVNDFSHGKLNKIDALGNSSQFASGYGLVGDFTIDPYGNYYLTDHSSIGTISFKGRFSWLVSNLNSPPSDLICDSKGNVYTGSIDNTINKITPTGAVVSFHLDNNYGGLRCMTIDKDANIYVIMSNQNSNYESLSSIFKITY